MELALVARWAVALALLTALGAPVAATVFARFPRRGAAFALPTALAVLATVVFLVGQVTFGRHTVVLGVFLVGGLSLVAYRAGEAPDWRAVAGSYGVFLLGFCLFVVYASENAAITPRAGEQFLHYGLTNALVHAESLPPEDFWFAGEPLRYYYGTQLQVAMLSMLTGTELRYGYYLALATFYGVLFVGAYGLAGAVVAVRGRSYHLGGALGAAFVALAGTSVTFLRLAFGWLPDRVRADHGEPVFRGLTVERGMSFDEAVASQGGVDGWLWFYERYVAEAALHEFPLYAFVKADLHGHTLSTGYVVLAAAVAFSYYLTPAERRRRRLAVLYGGLGLVAGVFGFMNTWALPTAVGLAWLAVAAADPHPATLLPGRVAARLDPGDSPLRRRLPAEAWRVVLAAVFAVPVGVVGVAVASPFLVFGQVPTNEGVGLFPPRTPLDSFLVLYGGVLVLVAGYLVAASRPLPVSRVHLGAGGVLCLALGIAASSSFAVVGLVVAFLAVAWWLVRTDRAGFTAVLVVAGLGLLLSLELVHARVYPFDRVRWNTTLKVAIQGWTLAALGAGAAGALLLSGAAERLDRSWSGPETPGCGRTGWSSAKTALPAACAVVLVLGVLATSLPFAALVFYGDVGSDGLSPREGSLDALANHDQFRGEEMAALYWLDERGQPTVLEAPARRSYQWKSTASVFTGAVTVAGWDHQEGYRGEAAFDERATAVESAYVGPVENVTGTLDRYDVEYIYVGPSEREAFDDVNEFERVDGVSVAFENDAARIYAVDQESLGEGAGDRNHHNPGRRSPKHVGETCIR